MNQNRITIKIGESDEIFEDVQSLHRTIWGLSDLEVTPTHIYMAAHHAGGKILCAYAGDEPVGYVFGFPGVDAENNPYFYSHNLAVLEKWRNRGIASRLKLRLREVLLESGFNLVKWTYEPLDSKNAYAYIGKLGGISNTYHREYYGEMRDEINRGLPSDRLVIDWFIQSNHVSRKIKREALRTSLEEIQEANIPLNSIGWKNAVPYPREEDAALNVREVDQYYFEIPTNLDDLRESSPEAVLEWRFHVRTLLETGFAKGLSITDAVYNQQRFFYILEPFQSTDN